MKEHNKKICKNVKFTDDYLTQLDGKTYMYNNEVKRHVTT